VKSPKIYVADSGLLHTMLDLTAREDLEGHPKLGASWEGFMLDMVIRQLGARPDQCYFWATHAGAELDLLIVRGRERYGFEFKRTSAPQVTRSMHTALEDLKLTRLDVIHAGDDSFPLAPKVRAVAASRIIETFAPEENG
jgi:predicted AAA+ superfamily ATPase